MLLNCRVSKNGWREDAYYYTSKMAGEKAHITLHKILKKEVIYMVITEAAVQRCS